MRRTDGRFRRNPDKPKGRPRYLVANERRYFEGPMKTENFSLESGGFFFERTASKADWLKLTETGSIGVRFEVGRDFWYGNDIDLKAVRGSIQDFLNQC